MNTASTTINLVPDESMTLPVRHGPTLLEPNRSSGARAGGSPSVSTADMSPLRSSKSSGALCEPNGRGKGLSIAAPRYKRPGQTGFQRFNVREGRGGHLGGHLGANCGPIDTEAPKVPHLIALNGGDHRG